MSQFSQLDTALLKMLSDLSASSRSSAMREIANTLRQRNSERITAQVDPDGAAFEARKPQTKRRGRVPRRGAMFKRLKTSAYLKATATANTAEVSFNGRGAGIAAVHHFGLIDKVRAGLSVLYPARRLLGLPETDREAVRDILLRHLNK